MNMGMIVFNCATAGYGIKAWDVGEKSKSALREKDRLYYGAEKFRGMYGLNSDGRARHNTTVNPMGEREFKSAKATMEGYKEYLEDTFYRRFMEYEPNYLEAPEDPAHLEMYNQVAVESGHPEYCLHISFDEKESEMSKSEESHRECFEQDSISLEKYETFIEDIDSNLRAYGSLTDEGIAKRRVNYAKTALALIYDYGQCNEYAKAIMDKATLAIYQTDELRAKYPNYKSVREPKKKIDAAKKFVQLCKQPVDNAHVR